MINGAEKEFYMISAASGPIIMPLNVDTGDDFAVYADRQPYYAQMATATVYQDYYGKKIEERLSSIEKELKELRELLQTNFKNENNNFEFRHISLDQARDEIALYFRENDGKEIGYEELIEELQIEPSLVVRACSELVEEGKIG